MDDYVIRGNGMSPDFKEEKERLHKKIPLCAFKNPTHYEDMMQSFESSTARLGFWLRKEAKRNVVAIDRAPFIKPGLSPRCKLWPSSRGNPTTRTPWNLEIAPSLVLFSLRPSHLPSCLLYAAFHFLLILYHLLYAGADESDSSAAYGGNRLNK